MTERGRLEDQLTRIQGDLDKASHAFESSVDTLTELLGSGDTTAINTAKDAMQMWGETVRSRTEEQRALQRRLEHLTSAELTHGAIRAARSASRAARATFWVAVFAMVASTAATIMAALVATAR